MISDILQDWDANAGSPKGRFVMAFFRLCARIRRSRAWWVGLPVLALYVFVVHWVLGIELDYRSEVGAGLGLYHGVGLVVNRRSVIGAGCSLRHSTTLGEKVPGGPCPVLGRGVSVGPHVVILGGVQIGEGAVIGAGSVVVGDVAPGAVVAGNPARVLEKANPTA